MDNREILNFINGKLIILTTSSDKSLIYRYQQVSNHLKRIIELEGVKPSIEDFVCEFKFNDDEWEIINNKTKEESIGILIGGYEYFLIRDTHGTYKLNNWLESLPRNPSSELRLEFNLLKNTLSYSHSDFESECRSLVFTEDSFDYNYVLEICEKWSNYNLEALGGLE